ncbi:MAG TPA: hypothetical protein VMU99_07420 [Acidimicrobiales bacterium]|nr:hypothetical protein [Acidimicrobiales bacterium]
MSRRSDLCWPAKGVSGVVAMSTTQADLMTDAKEHPTTLPTRTPELQHLSRTVPFRIRDA